MRRLLFRPGIRELALLAGLYLAYSLARDVSSNDPAVAHAHAAAIIAMENPLHLDLEHWLNDVFWSHRATAVVASLYYASAHYVVTPTVLAWMWFRRRDTYVPVRRALVLATATALLVYLLWPATPPRLYGDFHDILASTSNVGWWSQSASAPKGLGGLTDQLAAMPSMHVGWALWCALTLQQNARWVAVRGLGWAHLAMTTVVVIGTGNHWTLDALAGAAVMAAAWTAMAYPTPAERTGESVADARQDSSVTVESEAA